MTTFSPLTENSETSQRTAHEHWQHLQKLGGLGLLKSSSDVNNLSKSGESNQKTKIESGADGEADAEDDDDAGDFEGGDD